MGKDIKGKELGKGIRQLKNGQYNARFTTARGDRKEKNFDKLQQAKNWLRKAKEDNETYRCLSGDTLTVDQWFKQWMTTFMRYKLETTSYFLYEFLYYKNISPVIGEMKMSQIKPYHCQLLVNEMNDRELSPSYIRKTASVAKCMFLSATENDVIPKTPYVSTISLPKMAYRETDFLTFEMIDKFMEAISERCVYALQYKLILETGMRAGELSALTVDSIDFENNVIHIRQALHYLKDRGFYIGNLKTESSKRDIPMSKEARQILEEAMERRKNRKKILPEWEDLVFTNRHGRPIYTAVYDKTLRDIAEKRMHVKPFSMHDLRRTFSTMCYNAGCKDKDISTIMGHSNVQTTLRHYIKRGTEDATQVIKQLENFKTNGVKMAEMERVSI